MAKKNLQKKELILSVCLYVFVSVYVWGKVIKSVNLPLIIYFI